jgi:hypothetical protein
MAWTKAKTAIVVGVSVLLATGTTTVIIKEMRSSAKQLSQTTSAAYPGDWIWQPDSRTLDRVPPLLLLQPTKLPSNQVPFDMFGKNRYLARGKTVKELIAAVYSQINSAAKITFLAQLPDDKYDCIDTLQNTNWCWSLQSEINQRFGLVEQYKSDPHGSGTVLVLKKAS